MGPHFRLESVMRLRRSEQRQHEFLLQKENAIVDRLLRKVVEFDREILRISNAPPHARTGAEIEFDHERVRILAAEQKELQENCSPLANARKLRLQRYMAHGRNGNPGNSATA